MNFNEKFRNLRKKYGRNALYVFLLFFITKWIVTIIFGAQVIDFLKDKMP